MKRILPLVVSIIILAVAVGGYVFMTARLNSALERGVHAAEAADTLTKKDRALQGAGELLRATQPLAETLATFVSSETDVVKGIELLEAAGRQSGINLDLGNVNVSPLGSWSYHEALVIDLTAEGSFTKLTKFLSIVESLPHLARLERASLKKVGKSSWTVAATVVFVKQKP